MGEMGERFILVKFDEGLTVRSGDMEFLGLGF